MGSARRGVPVTLALEMFERDMQAERRQLPVRPASPKRSFSRHLAPWPRYATDYRPLVEFAKAHGWPVVAANVPRRYRVEPSPKQA